MTWNPGVQTSESRRQGDMSDPNRKRQALTGTVPTHEAR